MILTNNTRQSVIPGVHVHAQNHRAQEAGKSEPYANEHDVKHSAIHSGIRTQNRRSSTEKVGWPKGRLIPGDKCFLTV